MVGPEETPELRTTPAPGNEPTPEPSRNHASRSDGKAAERQDRVRVTLAQAGSPLAQMRVRGKAPSSRNGRDARIRRLGVRTPESGITRPGGDWSSMREPYSRDLKRLLDLELERNDRVRAIIAAYQELAEGEKTLFRLAAGITQDGAGTSIEPRQRSSSEGNEGTQPDQVQPIVRNLMKSLLEDHPSLLTETDIIKGIIGNP